MSRYTCLITAVGLMVWAGSGQVVGRTPSGAFDTAQQTAQKDAGGDDTKSPDGPVVKGAKAVAGGAKKIGGDTADGSKKVASKVAGTSKKVAAPVAETGKEVGADAVEGGKKVGSQVASTAKKVSAPVADRGKKAAKKVGSGLKGLVKKDENKKDEK